MKDAPSPMLKKVASVPSRLYSKVWQEYLVILVYYIVDTALYVTHNSAFLTLVVHLCVNRLHLGYII